MMIFSLTICLLCLVFCACLSPKLNWNAVCVNGDGQYLSAAVYGGFIFFSHDYGQSWQQSNATYSGWNYIAVSESGQYYLAANDQGYCEQSSDFGMTWILTHCNNLNIAPKDINFGQVGMSANGQYRISAFSIGFPSISHDFGQTWFTPTNPAGYHFPLNFTTYGSTVSGNGQYMFAGTQYAYIGNASNSGTIFVSSDYGITWSPAGSVLPSNRQGYWWGLDCSYTGQYVGAVSSNYGLFLSSDYGQTFNQSLSELTVDIKLSHSGQHLFGTNSSTLYRSLDFGMSWTVDHVGGYVNMVDCNSSCDSFLTFPDATKGYVEFVINGSFTDYPLPTSQPSSQPSLQPTTVPSAEPSNQPSSQPTVRPTGQPSCQPSSYPSQPSTQPSAMPSMQPSSQPSTQPSQPTSIPSMHPTKQAVIHSNGSNSTLLIGAALIGGVIGAGCVILIFFVVLGCYYYDCCPLCKDIHRLNSASFDDIERQKSRQQPGIELTASSSSNSLRKRLGSATMSTWYHSRQNVFINDPTTEVEEVINELSLHNDTVVNSSELSSSPGKGKSTQRWSAATIDNSSRSNSRLGFYTASTSSNRSIRLPTEEEEAFDDHHDNSNSSHCHEEQKTEQHQQLTADIPSIHLPSTAVSATSTTLIPLEDEDEDEDAVVVDDLQQLSLTPPPPSAAAVAQSLISNI